MTELVQASHLSGWRDSPILEIFNKLFRKVMTASRNVSLKSCSPLFDDPLKLGLFNLGGSEYSATKMASSLRQRYYVWSSSKPYVLLTMTFALVVGKLSLQPSLIFIMTAGPSNQGSKGQERALKPEQTHSSQPSSSPFSPTSSRLASAFRAPKYSPPSQSSSQFSDWQ